MISSCASSYSEFFARRNIRFETVNDGRRGLARALDGGHDLLLLDVMMPGLDGLSCCDWSGARARCR